MRQLVLEIAPPRDPSFEDFVIGGNAELVAKLRDLAQGTLAESVVYLWGDHGSGRSHLLAATKRAAVNPQNLEVADDVDRLDEPGQIALFNRINEIRASGGEIRASGGEIRASGGEIRASGGEIRASGAPAGLLAAGPVPPAQLALRDDLKSRLAWGLAYQVKTLTDAEKAVYLREEAGRRGLRIADEVIWYLLTHVRRDLPSLVAIAAHLDAYSLSHRRPITLPLVREALAALEQ